MPAPSRPPPAPSHAPAPLAQPQKLAGASLLIFANKQDLEGALSCEEIATVLELGGEQFGTRHWSITPCSAVTGHGLVDGVNWLVDDIAGRIFVGK